MCVCVCVSVCVHVRTCVCVAPGEGDLDEIFSMKEIVLTNCMSIHTLRNTSKAQTNTYSNTHTHTRNDIQMGQGTILHCCKIGVLCVWDELLVQGHCSVRAALVPVGFIGVH